MIKIKQQAFFLLVACLFLAGQVPMSVQGQTIKGYSKDQVSELSTKVEDQVRFLEFLLNTVGSAETSARDKDVIIRESYLKIFRDAKVQVEDDLLMDRKVVTNKDVTAYFKDLEFFFKNIEFKFKIREIKAFQNENGDVFFLVSLDRTLTAVGLKGEKISNTQLRFVEVNLDEKSQELKIASIYTTKISRDEELKAWWKSLDSGWKAYFSSRFQLSSTDSVELAQLYRMVAVDSVNLSGNRQIRNLSALSELRDLKFLDISYTTITNLSPISTVTFLRGLNLSHTPTAEIQFIKYADRLQVLDISSTQIQDIGALLNLKSLLSLRVEKTPIQSFAVLNEFIGLKELYLSESGFNNAENIKDLIQLERLDLSKNFILNFSFLSQLTSLQELKLFQTNIKDISPLASLSALNFLDISASPVADLSPLEGLLRLRKVAADQTQVSVADANFYSRSHPEVLLIHHVKDLESWWQGLSTAWKEALRKVNPSLGGDQVGMEALTQTLKLTELDIQDSGIETLTPLMQFISLTSLNFSGNPLVTDVLPVAEVKTLRELAGRNSGVYDLSVLTGNNLLERIDVEGSPVVSINALISLSKLTYLNVNSGQIDLEELPEFLLQRPDLNVIYRSEALQQWWEGLEVAWKEVFQNKFALSKEPSTEELHRMTSSSELVFDRIALPNLSPLPIFINLRSLSVFDAPLTLIDPVSQLSTLRSLRLSQVSVLDYLPISGLYELTELDLSTTRVEEVAAFAGLAHLKKLNLSGSNIKNLKGIEALKDLEELDVASTDIKSLKALEGLRLLKKLTCFNTKLSPRAIDNFKADFPFCEVRFY